MSNQFAYAAEQNLFEENNSPQSYLGIVDEYEPADICLRYLVKLSSTTYNGYKYFCCPDNKLKKDTKLTRSQIERSKPLLKDKGFISTFRRGVPAKTHYRVHMDKINASLRFLIKNDNNINSHMIPGLKSNDDASLQVIPSQLKGIDQETYKSIYNKYINNNKLTYLPKTHAPAKKQNPFETESFLDFRKRTEGNFGQYREKKGPQWATYVFNPECTLEERKLTIKLICKELDRFSIFSDLEEKLLMCDYLEEAAELLNTHLSETYYEFWKRTGKSLYGYKGEKGIYWDKQFCKPDEILILEVEENDTEIKKVTFPGDFKTWDDLLNTLSYKTVKQITVERKEAKPAEVVQTPESAASIPSKVEEKTICTPVVENEIIPAKQDKAKPMEENNNRQDRLPPEPVLVEDPPLPDKPVEKPSQVLHQPKKINNRGQWVVDVQNMVLTESLRSDATLCGVQDEHVDRLWSTEEGQGKFKQSLLRLAQFQDGIPEYELHKRWKEFCNSSFSDWAKKIKTPVLNPQNLTAEVVQLYDSRIPKDGSQNSLVMSKIMEKDKTLFLGYFARYDFGRLTFSKYEDRKIYFSTNNDFLMGRINNNPGFRLESLKIALKEIYPDLEGIEVLKET